eukprot:3433688-Rhodomonas_salina.1
MQEGMTHDGCSGRHSASLGPLRGLGRLLEVFQFALEALRTRLHLLVHHLPPANVMPPSRSQQAKKRK